MELMDSMAMLISRMPGVMVVDEVGMAPTDLMDKLVQAKSDIPAEYHDLTVDQYQTITSLAPRPPFWSIYRDVVNELAKSELCQIQSRGMSLLKNKFDID